MTDHLTNAIYANLPDLVNIEDRTVEPTNNAADDLAIAFVDDGNHPEDYMFDDMPVKYYQAYHADMMRVFANRLKPEEFFSRYAAQYYALRDWVVQDSAEKIWNMAVDEYSIPPIDIYDYNGVRREDF